MSSGEANNEDQGVLVGVEVTTSRGPIFWDPWQQSADDQPPVRPVAGSVAISNPFGHAKEGI